MEPHAHWRLGLSVLGAQQLWYVGWAWLRSRPRVAVRCGLHILFVCSRLLPAAVF